MLPVQRGLRQAQAQRGEDDACRQQRHVSGERPPVGQLHRAPPVQRHGPAPQHEYGAPQADAVQLGEAGDCEDGREERDQEPKKPAPLSAS